MAWRRRSDREQAREALTEVGLGDRTGHLPSELSGGQQQRVAIARALVKRPGVLLADEPTGNLDEGTRDDIMTLLERMWREHGLTMVMVTHDSTVARRAQRIGLMRNGRINVRSVPAQLSPGPRKRPGKANAGCCPVSTDGSCVDVSLVPLQRHQTHIHAGRN